MTLGVLRVDEEEELSNSSLHLHLRHQLDKSRSLLAWMAQWLEGALCPPIAPTPESLLFVLVRSLRAINASSN